MTHNSVKQRLNRHKISRRAGVMVVALASVLSLAVGYAPVTQANAVTYSQLLAKRSQAAASRQRVATLKSQLSGVSSDLRKEILDLDDLTNNKIPAAQDSVSNANSASADADDAAQAASNRLAAARKDKADLEVKIKETGKDYDDARADTAQIVRESLHGSNAADTMSIITDSSSARDYVNSAQSQAAVSRKTNAAADDAAETLSTSKNREQRLADIEKQIITLKATADSQAATAKQVANDAAAKQANLENLRDEGARKRAALEAKQSQLQSSAAQEAAATLLIESQVDSFNRQYAAQQAAAAKQAAANAAKPQGTTRPSGSVPTPKPSLPSPGTNMVVGHPTGDVGNAYPFSQCTWWAYIRRHQLGLPVGSYFGNGGWWWSSAMKLGYQVNHTPSVGAIVSFLPGQNGSNPRYGHVAIVERVNANGTILTSNCGASMRGAIYYQTVSNPGAYWYIHN